MNRVTSGVSVPETGVVLKQDNVVAHVNNRCLQNGILYVAESCLVWISESGLSGFTIEYPSVTMHAVSNDCSSFPRKCIYAVLDVAFEDEAPGDGTVSVTELRFVPTDVTALQSMFAAISACQRLHPDKLSSDEGEYCNEDEADDDDELDLSSLPEADQIVFQRTTNCILLESSEADSLEGAVNRLSTNDVVSNGHDVVAMDTGTDSDSQQFDDAVE